MGFTFDGPNKLIILTSGTTIINTKDMYSRWKEWVLLSDNAKYLIALSSLGGDPLVGGQFLGTTIFLENDWKIRPQESNHVLVVEGNLYSRGGSSPFVSTLGSYNVRIEMRVSNLVDALATTGASFNVNDIWGHAIEGTFTAEEVLKVLAAALAGKSTGSGTSNIIYRNISDTKDVIDATVVTGNRTSVTLDVS